VDAPSEEAVESDDDKLENGDPATIIPFMSKRPRWACLAPRKTADPRGGTGHLQRRLVGPTIRVRRGTTLRINVINDLPKTGQPPVTVNAGPDDEPHDLYTTNLHTHGLHVSPIGNSDNVFREIPPGSSFQYAFTIPADHPTGHFGITRTNTARSLTS